MWGIQGYEPEPLTTANDIFARHGAGFAALIGRRLDRASALTFVSDDSWCSTGPLALHFDGDHQLEVLAEGFATLHLSWNTVDLDAVLELDEDPDLALAWADLDAPELRPLLGAKVRDVWILERNFRVPQPDGEIIEAWLLAGIEFAFEPDGRTLQLGIGLDELVLAAERPESDGWRRRHAYPRS
jgi:hypothetical protein